MILSSKRVLRGVAAIAATASLALGPAVSAQASAASHATRPAGSPPTTVRSPNIEGPVTWEYDDGSAVSSDGCKAWLNIGDDKDATEYVQGVLESWGSTCEMHFVRDNPSGATDISRFDQITQVNTFKTGPYYDDTGYKAAVCVWNVKNYNLHECSGFAF
jgi:hypothetical protein